LKMYSMLLEKIWWTLYLAVMEIKSHDRNLLISYQAHAGNTSMLMKSKRCLIINLKNKILNPI